MDQREEVGPRQLSHQRYDNLPVGEDFGELDHAAEVLFPKSASKLSLQLCTQCGHDLLPIVRPLFLEDVLPDALPDVPIERGKARIHGPRHALAGLRIRSRKSASNTVGFWASRTAASGRVAGLFCIMTGISRCLPRDYRASVC